MPSSDESWFDGFLGVIRDAGSRRPPSAPPALIAARYELGALLGEGGAALVYRARDRGLGRDVAVKILREPVGGASLVRERFQREAQVTASLSHPNVVALHDVGEDGGQLYLVMELIEGEPLGRRMARPDRDLRALVALLLAAARGVGAAHRKGIVHRDLKPANILVTAAGEPKVGDFGLARVSGADAALTRHGAVMGTPLYMAPEQVQGFQDRIGSATDVYALGAILYEMITGHPPHTGSSVTEIYGRIISQDPAAPSRLAPGTPRGLETITLKAIDKDPARRYGDADAFADDLRRYLDGEPIHAKPPGSIYRLRRAIQRRRTALALAAVVVICGLVVWRVEHRRREDVSSAARKTDAERFCREAVEQQRLRKWAGMEEAYTKALAIDGDLVIALAGRAISRLNAGNVDGAAADAREALKRDPLCYKAMNVQTAMDYNAHDFDGAMSKALEIRKRAPEGSEEARYATVLAAKSLAGRANTKLQAGDREAARADLVEGERLDPDCLFVAIVQANLNNQEGRVDATIERLQALLRRATPSDPDVGTATKVLYDTCMWRGNLREKAGKLREATEDYERALAAARDADQQARAERCLKRLQRK